jgi:hypothetical protein
MSRVYNIGSNGAAVQQNTASYANEAELEAMIVQNPDIVPGFTLGDVEVVGQQINLNGGSLKIDVLLIDRSGLLTVVEAKLARNGESRREIVAQGLDYASALAEYEFFDLDDELGGRIGQALDRLCGGDEALRESLEETARARLAASDVNVHLALDEEVLDLSRIVTFARRRGLSIGYTWFPRTSNGTGYSVRPQSSNVAIPSALPKMSSSASHGTHLIDAVKAFNALDCGTTFRVPSPRAVYKETYVSKYPRDQGVVHYEFMLRGPTISAELHIETPRGAPLTQQQTTMQACFPRIVSDVNGLIGHLGLVAVIDPKWSSLRAGGRVRIMMPISGPTAHIAEAMRILIANS